MNKTVRNIINVLLIVVFIVLASQVYNSNEGILFDYTVLNFLHKSTNNIVLYMSKFISFLGSGLIISVGIFIATIYFGKKRKYYTVKMLLANSAGSYILNASLKEVIHRIRPVDYFRIEYSGLSFPSGHSMTTMSLILTICYLISRDKDKNYKINIYSVGLIYILLMGLSRLYLGVHWPTDIIGGYICGYFIYRNSLLWIKDKTI